MTCVKYYLSIWKKARASVSYTHFLGTSSYCDFVCNSSLLRLQNRVSSVFSRRPFVRLYPYSFVFFFSHAVEAVFAINYPVLSLITFYMYVSCRPFNIKSLDKPLLPAHLYREWLIHEYWRHLTHIEQSPPATSIYICKYVSACLN